jgi:6-phosphogluconolactonase (cycloisomerase 2 family)
VIQFAIDSAGRLTEVSSLSLPSVGINVPNGIAMTPNGSTLYVQMFSPNVAAFAVDPSTGNLTQKATVACNCGNADEGGGLVVNSKGTLLFEGVGGESFNDGGVALYSIDQSTGALTPLSNSFISIGSMGAPSFALDSGGTFLYATGFLVNFKGFSVTDSGMVTPVPGSPFAQTAAQALFMVKFKP